MTIVLEYIVISGWPLGKINSVASYCIKVAGLKVAHTCQPTEQSECDPHVEVFLKVMENDLKKFRYETMSSISFS